METFSIDFPFPYSSSWTRISLRGGVCIEKASFLRFSRYDDLKNDGCDK